ncbi:MULTISPECIES: accessory factor UbiK family protein [Inquilinus]|jgi:BMFP domain-containing protein YqiC|uniref:BMFP domain-containing protein YqiC n=1 Tax=Inquilinus ginsengisoli TaxID=363840 RepID=A0ABU1JMS5_9PROT|nr:accessory factor UbiK family protein [Inquilinus ginsengisoli]MDR6289918.1 BMFP domain-containing protein YqiC [Inquilinus ginsengisoli]
MPFDTKLIDDLVRVATGAFGAVAGVREEARSRLREQFEHVLSRLDVVTREEFEIVRALAQRAREEQELLVARVASLEAAAQPAAAKRSAPKPAAAKLPVKAAAAAAKPARRAASAPEAAPAPKRRGTRTKASD